MQIQFTARGLFISVVIFAWTCAAAPFDWHQEGKTKWAELIVPQEGKTGFTSVAVEQTGIQFTNVLDEWSSAANRVLENGSGAAVGDFDGDGRPDIFLCSLKGTSVLYRNLGDWKFEDVTSSAGANTAGFVCRGATFVDINGDGSLDLLVSTLGHGVLCFLNNGTGKFTNATPTAGTETEWGCSTMALADIDGNGTLDLYVANYRTDDIRDHARLQIQMVNGRVVLAPSLRERVIVTREGLREFGEPDQLYLNNGQGHFTPVSWTDGRFRDDSGKPLTAQPKDWGLTATFRDINGDGWPDLYVCNDYWTPDRVWINDGKGGFRALERLALRHTSENSMGMDLADIDRDGHVDLFVLDMLASNAAARKRQALAQTRVPTAPGETANRPQYMRNVLFHNRGDNTFEEIADFAGVTASGWSWQPVFIDVDLDGYEDLVISAGNTHDVQDLDATAAIRSRQHPWPKDIDPKEHQKAFITEMMEHARLYPSLQQPIAAFRNLGNLRFENATETWGTSAPGVHQGIAFGDFDGDGDLDFVVNNLNGAAGIFRNNGIGSRVAVRLKGLPPNTRGIGAEIKLLGGAVAMQSQEMICGGRYLSGDDPVRVFAAGGTTNVMRLEVRWRSGKRSVVNGVKANRIYEIEEAEADAASEMSSPEATPSFFKDASDLLGHQHVKQPFDDFERQPLLPKMLSQLGPGVSWFDLDGDGHEDLIIGSGKGGSLGAYRNDGHGGFESFSQPFFKTELTRDQTTILGWRGKSGRAILLAGSANYEDGLDAGSAARQYALEAQSLDDSLPGFESSTGPMALADMDGDGELDLFVGGRVVGGRYPEAASSRIFHHDGQRWQLDRDNSQRLDRMGLVSGAVWSDLDGDGFPELILACEWGPVRVFKNQSGHLREETDALGLTPYTGWWNGVTTGDLDGDGKLYIIASNWGLNSLYHASTSQPLKLYYGDFTRSGRLDVMETEYDTDRGVLSPRRRLDSLAASLAFLRERFSSQKSFSEATLTEVLGNDLLAAARSVQATTLASTVFLNRGQRFEAVELPREAQLAPAFAVNVADLDGDGREDIFLSQNFFACQPELPRMDAGRGLWLKNLGQGQWKAMPGTSSGIQIYGEQRGAAFGDYDEDGRIDLVVTQNAGPTKLLHNTLAKPGLRVRLAGPVGNSQGIGAVLRLRFGGRLGPARELHAGSGYWSQDSSVQILALPEDALEIQIAWPGGKTTKTPLPGKLREVIIDAQGTIVSSRL